MTIVLVLLANLSLHGTILAGCIGLVYLLDAIRVWNTLDAAVKRRYWISIAVMVAAFAFIVLILKPTPDVEEFVIKKELGQMPEAIRKAQPSKLVKLESVVSGAFLDYWAPSTAFILLAAWWSFTRRRLLIFALPVLSLIALYALIHGYAHHHGTVFIAAITALWIAWPDPEEQRTFDLTQRRGMVLITVALLCLCGMNLWDAEVALRHEYAFPYSGAEDAAKYLKSVGADRGKIAGFLYGVVGIQPYFDHNILVNFPNTYFHHGLPLYGFDLNIDEFRRMNPDYVVAFTELPEAMMEYGIPVIEAEGYEIVHVSDGYMIYKQGVYVRQIYFILRRVQH
jgi:MFS family permease